MKMRKSIGNVTLNRDTILPSVRGKKLTQRYTARAKRYAAVTTLEEGFVWARDRPAIGPWCMDIDGNVVLDFTSHVASAPFGYNHPEIVELMQNFVHAD